MADIFISYASEDKQRVSPIVDEFKKLGWSVFWDRTIPPGKRWHDVIAKELDDSSCVLVVWTQHSISSDWVRDEADEAKQRNVLVPLFLESVKAPLGFRNIQAADLSDWKNNSSHEVFQQLIAAVTDIIPPPEKPSLQSVVPSSVKKTVPPSVPALKIGDEYGGGKVAFIDATGKHGLIAAKADLPGGAKYTWEAAKKACEELVENGYSDWYLPAKDELNQLYQAKSAVGGFGAFYWSSTEGSAGIAWGQNFGGGSQVSSFKVSGWRVRPVRAF
jgi:hypothetical protein